MSLPEDKKAAALAVLVANEGNLTKTAQMTGVSRWTLKRWQDEDASESARAKKDAARKALADRLEEIARELAEAVPSAIHDADLQRRATALAIVIDKMQLLRGAPNNITRDEHSITGRVELATVESYRDWLASRAELKG